MGSASLSVWTHYLKGVEFIPDHSVGSYKGPAARVAAGTEAFEVGNAMAAANGSWNLVIPSSQSLGFAGGWSLGGGFGYTTSRYGLGVDQILSMNVITADGSFLTADPTQNEDLFFALRGGGGGMYILYLPL
jgi:FAD/FMN-containing dehydrogenase